MMISEKMAARLNEQVNNEFFSSWTYRAICEMLAGIYFGLNDLEKSELYAAKAAELSKKLRPIMDKLGFIKNTSGQILY